MIEYIRHVGITVEDLNRAIKFYQQLGFKLETTVVENWDGISLRIAKMSLPGHATMLELVNGTWPNHFSIQVPQDFITAQYQITMRKNNVVFIKDLDGNDIELVKGIT